LKNGYLGDGLWFIVVLPTLMGLIFSWAEVLKFETAKQFPALVEQ
jgi:hypothetical protein